MIQRIQTIFLLLAGGSVLSLFVRSMSLIKVDGDTSGEALRDGVLSVSDSPVLSGATALAGLLFVVGVFLFKNRKQQLQLTRGAIFINFVLLAVAIYFFYDGVKDSGGAMHISLQVGGLLPILSLLLGGLAARFIQKDEKLVRSSYDRLR